MTTAGDPYRVLGLQPGASLDEVKRAYRRLAKVAHPDSAGSTATARFIAVQRAYEAILRASPATRPLSRPAAAPNRRPAPGARPGRRSDWRTGGGADAGAQARASERGTDPAARASTGRPETDAPRRDGTNSRRETARRRAALGTTTYDGAESDVTATWQGASWYGVSTGTYWTVNPKEYADPRKHGPEYLRRGRGTRAAAIATDEAAADSWTPPATTTRSEARRHPGRATVPPGPAAAPRADAARPAASPPEATPHRASPGDLRPASQGTSAPTASRSSLLARFRSRLRGSR